MQSVIRRWTGRAVSRGYNLWRTQYQDWKRRDLIIKVAACAAIIWRKQLLGRAWRAWSHILIELKDKMLAISRQIVSPRLICGTTEDFVAEDVSVDDRLQELMNQMLMGRLMRGLTVLACLVSNWQNPLTSLQMMFHHWCFDVAIKGQKPLMPLMQRVVQRWKHNNLATALRTWCIWYCSLITSRNVARTSITRWFDRQLWKGYLQWLAVCAEAMRQ